MMPDSYDAIPYDSVPIHETHPAHLALQATLFGLTPVAPERARVLELGCASGGNLIPMAFYLPGAHFVGIDLSAGQVATGRELVSTLGLKNLRIEQANILELRDIGQFDYIIAHGLFSWAPAPVRERIFSLCAESLSPDGVAYISYNTLPGWRLRTMLRDMLLFFVGETTDATTRLARAYESLAQLEAALAERDDVIARYLHDEIARLRLRHPSYLYHEYLADVNEPVLFSNFMAQAKQHGLQYLCEVELQSMLTDGLGEAAERLVDRYEDVVAQEQCIDFLRQRVFRQTLLCRVDRQPVREFELDRFADFAYFGYLTPQEASAANIAEPQAYTAPDGAACTVQHPLTRAALRLLADAYPNAIPFETLAREAMAKEPARVGQRAGEKDQLLAEVTGLYLRQLIGASTEVERFPRPDMDKPRANALVRAQAAARLGHVATVRHLPMGLDRFSQGLLAYLDGTRTRAAIAEALARDIAAGRLVLEKVSGDANAMKAAVRQNCDRLLSVFARHGVLLPRT